MDAVFLLRALAIFAGLSHQAQAAQALTLIADSVAAGTPIDEHMQHVADRLRDGLPINWTDVEARVRAASDRTRSA